MIFEKGENENEKSYIDATNGYYDNWNDSNSECAGCNR